MIRSEIRDNSVNDLQRYGYVVMGFNLHENCWVGYDLEGNKWSVKSKLFDEGLTYKDAECDKRWYRVCRPDELVKHGAGKIPRVGVNTRG